MTRPRTWPSFVVALALAALPLTGWLRAPRAADNERSSQKAGSKEAGSREAEPKEKSPDKPAAQVRAHETLTLRGRVVIESEALLRLYGVKVEETPAERQVVLETRDGQLHPIIRDVRGRAFLKDDRLRELELELLARRYEGSPLIQIIRVYSLEQGGKFEVDYWCDVCAIPMFELKACECCQGETRLRKTPVRGGAKP